MQTIYLDWNARGAVTPIKDQKKCSACYAFAATAAFESHYFIHSGNLVDFSPQQLIDCSQNFKNNGCKGGFIEYSFEYYRTNKAMDWETYPYQDMDSNCTYNKKKGHANTKGFRYLPENDTDTMLEELKLHPILSSMASNNRLLGAYRGGVVSEVACGAELDHAVLIIGYGEDSIYGPFWIAKNCWGTWWGEKGFFKIKRDTEPGSPGVCGIHRNPLVPEM